MSIEEMLESDDAEIFLLGIRFKEKERGSNFSYLELLTFIYKRMEKQLWFGKANINENKTL
jgi:hypothetical protein